MLHRQAAARQNIHHCAQNIICVQSKTYGAEAWEANRSNFMLKPPKTLTGTLSILKEMHLSWWVLAAPYCCTLCSLYKRWASWVELNVSRASASFPDSHSASLASFHSPPVTQRYQNLHHGSSSQQTSDSVVCAQIIIIKYYFISHHITLYCIRIPEHIDDKYSVHYGLPLLCCAYKASHTCKPGSKFSNCYFTITCFQ